jgi:hypothetical protein
MRIIPSLLLLALFFLNPATAAGKDLPKVAIWDLAAGNIPLTHAQDLTSILVSEIVKLKKYEVYSQDNVRAIAGWTEERIKLGCTDSKCLIALGQLDIAKLISGRVGKIGNTYSVSLGLFDTQNARSENAISEFCRTEDELIILVQQAIRKLLGVQVDPPPSPAAAVDKMPPPSKSSSSAPVFLEIKTKVKGAEVLVDGQNMGEVPLRISGLSPGPHEVQVVRKGYEDWKQQILIQPNEKKVVEVSLKPSKQSEDSLLDRIFYLENCFFGRDKFDYFIRFRPGGILEGAPRTGRAAGTSKPESISFKPLDAKWTTGKSRVIIHFNSILGMATRRVWKMEIELDNQEDGGYHAASESSTEYKMGLASLQGWDGSTVKYPCQMKELPLP